MEQLRFYDFADFEVDAGKPNVRDYWSTPPEVVAEIERIYSIKFFIDACANAKNTKCSHFITEEMNSLNTDWIEYAASLGVPPVFFCNPPYSNPLLGLFVAKAWREAKLGATVVLLIPNSSDTKWYHRFVGPMRIDPKLCHQVRDWIGRIKFIPPPGIEIEENRPRAASLLVQFMPPEVKNSEKGKGTKDKRIGG